jgi:5-methylcytosine-specific restriction endonuclease McrA
MKLTNLKPRIAVQGLPLATLAPDSWRADKQTSSTQRGYGYAWQKARAGHLRNNPLCVYCQREGRVEPATVVDHKVPHRGDQTLFWDRSNWQSLCKPHHDGQKQREEAAARGHVA